MDMSKYFGESGGSRYLSGSDMLAAGLKPLQRRPAVIRAVDVREMPDGDKMIFKTLLDLANPDGRPYPKPALLSPAKSRSLMDAFGSNSDNWIGQQIELYAENMKMDGRPIVALRIVPIVRGNGKPAAPQAPKASPPPSEPMSWEPPSNERVPDIDDDEIPF